MVPARSGSKGVPNKNMQPLGGVSLIGRAGSVLRDVPFLDARVISTDSPKYAEEGRCHGLDAPFLRPPELSGDGAGAVETMQHALLASEAHYGTRFDVLLIVEPTSPLRTAADVAGAAELLVREGADSVVTVSPLDSKAHPLKILEIGEGGALRFFASDGAAVRNRQELKQPYYWRNGLCYALTRECLLERAAIFTERTLPLVVRRPVVNVDDALDLEWAEFLLRRGSGG